MPVDYKKLEAYAKRHGPPGRADHFTWAPGEVEIYHSHEEAEKAMREHEELMAKILAEAEEKTPAG